MVCKASSNKPGFSYFVGVNDRLIIKFRNFCESRSPAAGAVGILGRWRIHEYDGGVDGVSLPCAVAGLLSVNEAWAARLALEARPDKPGDWCRGE